MGVYVRKDSPFYQIYLEGSGVKERTKIRVDAPTAAQRKENRRLAEQTYHLRMTAAARQAFEPEPEPARERIGFREFADWYEIHVSAHKRGRVREGEILTNLHRAFDGRWLDEIATDAAIEWKTARLATVSASTWNRELDVLKHLLATAVPRYLDRSPLAGMKRQRQAKRALRILTPSEERRLLAVLGPVDRAIILTALDTLMRLGDILNLHRRDDHRTYLVVLDPKTSDTYEVPVSRRLRRALDALPGAADGYYFERRRTRTPRYTMKRVLERACAKAEIRYGREHDGITFHALRHTGASRMVERGADLRTVQEIGGWKSLRQLTRYTHPTDDAKRRAVELVSARTERERTRRSNSSGRVRTVANRSRIRQKPVRIAK
jgi:integrase